MLIRKRCWIVLAMLIIVILTISPFILSCTNTDEISSGPQYSAIDDNLLSAWAALRDAETYCIIGNIEEALGRIYAAQNHVLEAQSALWGNY